MRLKVEVKSPLSALCQFDQVVADDYVPKKCQKYWAFKSLTSILPVWWDFRLPVILILSIYLHPGRSL